MYQSASCNDNSCWYPRSGTCDDGGQGSTSDICSYGIKKITINWKIRIGWICSIFSKQVLIAMIVVSYSQTGPNVLRGPRQHFLQPYGPWPTNNHINIHFERFRVSAVFFCGVHEDWFYLRKWRFHLFLVEWRRLRWRRSRLRLWRLPLWQNILQKNKIEITNFANWLSTQHGGYSKEKNICWLSFFVDC